MVQPLKHKPKDPFKIILIPLDLAQTEEESVNYVSNKLEENKEKYKSLSRKREIKNSTVVKNKSWN